MKIKYYLQPYGSMLAIGIQGKPDDIVQAYNGLYNFNAIDGELQYCCDTFAYVLTNEEKLLRGLTAKAHNSLQRKYENKETGFNLRIVRNGKRISPLPTLARMKAERQIESFTRELFLHDDSTPIKHTEFTRGNNDFESSDESVAMYKNYRPSLKFDVAIE